MRRISGSASARPSGERHNALWGGKKRVRMLVGMAVCLLAAVGASTHSASAWSGSTYVTPWILSQAQNDPASIFNVVVQVSRTQNSTEAAAAVKESLVENPAPATAIKRQFVSVAGVSASLTGRQITKLAEKNKVESILADTRVKLASTTQFKWPAAAGVTANWSKNNPDKAYPAIAVVDSGVSNQMLGNRLKASVSMVGGSTSDAFGHGTLVASMAAGDNASYAGAEPRAKVVSIKVLDNNGVGLKSDVIAACDWILEKKSQYNIRIANFSLNTGGESFRFDALDRAVEKLWFNGIVVVTSAGNYAENGAETGVGYAPANDPFVITVGASDINNSEGISDDFAAPWSAWGRTQDGFRKPEVAAPGRRMVGSVPAGATLLTQFPDRVHAPGYLWMSGTSFSAPVVSGIAATILAENPNWTPDQVKGAIMETANLPAGATVGNALGVGVVNGAAASDASGAANPNLVLNTFVNNGTFNAQAWYQTASTNSSWNQASWSSASWANASWSSASWSSASWSSASWADASWANASWADASWANTLTRK